MNHIIQYGKVIQRSKNLAGIRRYVSNHLIHRIFLDHREHGKGQLSILFDNNASFTITFASWQVLCEFVRRWRNVYGAKVVVDGSLRGEVSAKWSPEGEVTSA